MYKCLSCGEEFLEPKLYSETVPYGCQEVEMPEQSCCPFCGGDYEEAKQCEYCGKYFLEEESRADVMCEECIEDTKERFSNLLNGNFSKQEIEVLNIIFDGKDLE